MDSVDLMSFIEVEYIEAKGISKSKAVTEFASAVGTTYATVYRWLKDDVYSVNFMRDESGIAYIEVVKQVAKSKR